MQSSSPLSRTHLDAMATSTVISTSAALPLSGKAGIAVSQAEVAPSTGGFAVDAPRYLIASPYTEAEHLLDLETLNAENGLLAEALVEMRPLRDDYATAPYAETFNWDEVVDKVRQLAAVRGLVFKETSWYIVAFRSQYKPTTDHPDLGILDKAAHAEAMASGGFLK